MSLVRLARADDAEHVAAIYRPYCEDTVVSFECAAPTVEEMAARIQTITMHYPWLVREEGGVVVGYAYASRHRDRAAYNWSVDTAVYVDRAHHRQGIGRALYAILFRLLALQGYFKAYAGITLPNDASIGLHEAVGFSRVGVYHGVGFKHGAWRDVAWFEAPLQAERPNPPAPVAVTAVIGTVNGIAAFDPDRRQGS